MNNGTKILKIHQIIFLFLSETYLTATSNPHIPFIYDQKLDADKCIHTLRRSRQAAADSSSSQPAPELQQATLQHNNIFSLPYFIQIFIGI